MKKYFHIISLFIIIHANVLAQNQSIDSLKYLLRLTKEDTSRVKLMSELCNKYKFNQPDSSMYYGNTALKLARIINSPKDEVTIMHNISLAYLTVGNDSKALQITLQGIKIAEKNSFIYDKGRLLLDLATINRNSENYPEALKICRESKNLFEQVGVSTFSTVAEFRIAETLSMMNELDSALYYGQMANEHAEQINQNWITLYTRFVLGEIYSKKGNIDLALSFYHASLQLSGNDNSFCNYAIAKVYQQIEMLDSGIYYAQKSLTTAQRNGLYSDIILANNLLSELFENEDPKKALDYKKNAFDTKVALDNLRTVTSLEAFIDYDEQEREFELEAAKTAYQNQTQRLWIFSISGALISAVILAFILFRNNKNKQKANALLKEQKEEVQSTLEKLKSTQSQLIQSEKMASLGELTAGIAHEIQNPLNFVNNFSEVSEELIEEVLGERIKVKDERDEKLEEEILGDIKENLSKIHHHGIRASSIVKGMLEHSRTSDGKKEPTDINALADEYLRLAYHGLRAKDKSFNAGFKTEFDESSPKVNVIPQDIGRVLLNLINNAFYAADKKAKSGVNNFKPEVIVSSKRLSESIEISVKDNGPGIPEEIKDKIFQPFFTTKPTGSGTGLGLSLSYDIVKGHGGELKVESLIGDGSTFIVRIPFSKNMQ